MQSQLAYGKPHYPWHAHAFQPPAALLVAHLMTWTQRAGARPADTLIQRGLKAVGGGYIGQPPSAPRPAMAGSLSGTSSVLPDTFVKIPVLPSRTAALRPHGNPTPMTRVVSVARRIA